jgi:nuclear protein localization protein 4 homolog
MVGIDCGPAPPRPSTSAPGISSGTMDEDIPSDLFHQIAAQQVHGANGGPGSSGIMICPHCTFENTHSGTDCEVCGLPLG